MDSRLKVGNCNRGDNDGKWIETDYNKLYVHSELGYMSPEVFEELYYKEGGMTSTTLRHKRCLDKWFAIQL